MLLRQEVEEGIDVLRVAGQVQAEDVVGLQQAVVQAVGRAPRGVLIDLTQATALVPEAVDLLAWTATQSIGSPHPSGAVCCPPPELSPFPGVHASRKDAPQHVDERLVPHTVIRARIPSDERGPGQARRVAEQCAREHGVPSDDLALVVSELVTNAVRHGAPPVELVIGCGERGVTVVVADASPGRPAARVAQEDDEGGRGMLLVEQLSHQTGVRPQPPGKAVWAELPRTPAR